MSLPSVSHYCPSIFCPRSLSLKVFSTSRAKFSKFFVYSSLSWVDKFGIYCRPFPPSPSCVYISSFHHLAQPSLKSVVWTTRSRSRRLIRVPDRMHHRSAFVYPQLNFLFSVPMRVFVCNIRIVHSKFGSQHLYTTWHPLIMCGFFLRG